MTVRTAIAAGALLLCPHGIPAHAQTQVQGQAKVQLATPPAASNSEPTPAPAITPEAAKALEAQIGSWFTALSAAEPGATTAPVQVTPEGDHFALSAPLHLPGPVRGDARMTATARPLPAGRWSIADIRTAVPFTFVMDTPLPPADTDTKDGRKAPPRTVPVTYTVNAASQDGTVEYDPSFATPSEWKSSAKSLTVLAEGPGIAHATAIASLSGTARLTPAAAGRLDFMSNASFSGYTLASKAGADTPAMTLSMEGGSVDLGANGVNRQRIARLAELAAQLGALNRTAAPGTAPKPPPEMVKAMLEALGDVASDMKLQEAFQGLRLNVSGMDFAASDASFGLTARAENGLLRAGLDLAYDGFQLPALNFGGLEQLVPRKVVLHPYVSGVSVPDLLRIGQAVDAKRDPAPADIDALFSHGGLVAGLEQLALDVGGASFSGAGKVTMTGMQSLAGTGRLTADNFDALIQKLGTLPAAQQVMPAVIFLKGIGKADGSRLVWDIDYNGSRLTVNSMDLSAMIGAAAPPPPRAAAPHAAPPNAPQRPNRNR